MAGQVGRERIEEVIDPELTIERAIETYAKADMIRGEKQHQIEEVVKQTGIGKKKKKEAEQ